MTSVTGEPARSKQSRLAAILDLLATHGRLSVADAAAALDVSEATVRRDFTDLDARRLVSRNHGEIVANSVAYELPYRYRVSNADATLERIGERAASLVLPGEVVVLNGGTTMTATARALTGRDDLARPGQPLTLVTNALNIASEAVLRSHVQCVSVGGVARPESYEVSGHLALLVIEQMWFDVALIGVDGLTPQAGATCRHDDEAAIVREMVERSKRVVIVTASEKLGRNAFASMCPVERIDAVVTDADEQHAEVKALRNLGIAVHCVRRQDDE